MDREETILGYLNDLSEADRAFLAATALNLCDPLYFGKADWDAFFKQLVPAHAESLDRWLGANPLKERY